MSKVIQANIFFTAENIETDIIIIGDNISTPENIGSLIRLTDNIGAKKLFLINNIIPNKAKIKRNSSSSYNNVDFSFINYGDLTNDFFNKYTFIGIDTVDNSKNIYEYNFPKHTAFIVGNESFGISEEIIKLCKNFIHIPMPGNTKSMNVSHALAVSLFEYYRQNI